MNLLSGDLLALLRQASATLIILVLMSSPVSVFAQSSEQQRQDRGIKVPTTSTTTSKTDQVTSDLKPELVIQSSHTKPINAIVFSPDGNWLASGANDDTIKIWDTSTGHVLRTLYGHSSNVNALAISRDGKLLASGSGDMTSKREIPTFKRGGIVGGARDNTVRIWDVQTDAKSRRCVDTNYQSALLHLARMVAP
jgi:WD40 repeat protein